MLITEPQYTHGFTIEWAVAIDDNFVQLPCFSVLQQLINKFIVKLKSTYNWLDIWESDLNFLDLLWGKLDFLRDLVLLERWAVLA